VKGARDFLAKLRKDDLDAGDAELRRWKVMRQEEHVYDLWVVWVENGSFFIAGSPEPIPVHIVQGTYAPLADDATTLAKELEDSEPDGGIWSLKS
jgi:hypothetical protein